jgi:hypothetical protein
MTCCFFSLLKTLLTRTEDNVLGVPVNVLGYCEGRLIVSLGALMPQSSR